VHNHENKPFKTLQYESEIILNALAGKIDIITFAALF
jgi:hypothetical protein